MVSKMWEIKLYKIVANLLDINLRKLYRNGSVIQKFLAVLNQWKILGNICYSEQIIHRKQSLGAPGKESKLSSRASQKQLAPVVQTLDIVVIHRINHYLADKY